MGSKIRHRIEQLLSMHPKAFWEKRTGPLKYRSQKSLDKMYLQLTKAT
jgi:hypothetical protein